MMKSKRHSTWGRRTSWFLLHHVLAGTGTSEQAHLFSGSQFPFSVLTYLADPHYGRRGYAEVGWDFSIHSGHNFRSVSPSCPLLMIVSGNNLEIIIWAKRTITP